VIVIPQPTNNETMKKHLMVSVCI